MWSIAGSIDRAIDRHGNWSVLDDDDDGYDARCDGWVRLDVIKNCVVYKRTDGWMVVGRCALLDHVYYRRSFWWTFEFMEVKSFFFFFCRFGVPYGISNALSAWEDEPRYGISLPFEVMAVNNRWWNIIKNICRWCFVCNSCTLGNNFTTILTAMKYAEKLERKEAVRVKY